MMRALLISVLILVASPVPFSAWAQVTFERTFGGPGPDFGASVIQTADDGYLVVGMTLSFGAGEEDVYLVGIDAAGDTLWTRTAGRLDDERGASVKGTIDGGVCHYRMDSVVRCWRA